MPVDIPVPSTMPIGLVDTGANKRLPIDYLEAARAAPNQPLEGGAVHLGAGRKLGAGGTAMPFKVNPSASQEVWASVPLEPYTKWAEVAVLYGFAGTTGDAEIDIETDTTSPSSLTREFSKTEALTAAAAKLGTYKVQVGQGDKNDLGRELVTITFTNNSGSGALYVYGIDIQPLAERTIEV